MSLTTDNIVNIVAATIALIAAIVSCWQASKAHTQAAVSNAIAMGQAENSIRESIRQTRSAIREFAAKIDDLMGGRRIDQLNVAEKRRKDVLESALNDAIEDHVNAYDDACAKYIDSKTDRDRFKKTYFSDIKELCEQKVDHSIGSFLHPESTTKFRSVWRVYRDWHVTDA